jgi:hypothetical protein
MKKYHKGLPILEDPNISHCPECKAEWKGDKSALVGIEIRGEYDGVSYWECRNCNTAWRRNFPKFDESEMTEVVKDIARLASWYKRKKK